MIRWGIDDCIWQNPKAEGDGSEVKGMGLGDKGDSFLYTITSSKKPLD